jgi:hypothetical protein
MMAFVSGVCKHMNGSDESREVNLLFLFVLRFLEGTYMVHCSDTVYICAGEVAYRARRTVTCFAAERHVCGGS